MVQNQTSDLLGDEGKESAVLTWLIDVAHDEEEYGDGYSGNDENTYQDKKSINKPTTRNIKTKTNLPQPEPTPTPPPKPKTAGKKKSAPENLKPAPKVVPKPKVKKTESIPKSKMDPKPIKNTKEQDPPTKPKAKRQITIPSKRANVEQDQPEPVQPVQPHFEETAPEPQEVVPKKRVPKATMAPTIKLETSEQIEEKFQVKKTILKPINEPPPPPKPVPTVAPRVPEVVPEPPVNLINDSVPVTSIDGTSSVEEENEDPLNVIDEAPNVVAFFCKGNENVLYF